MESQQHNLSLKRLRPLESRDQYSEDFLIRKATMIRKNVNKISDVYKISKRPLGTGAYGVVCPCKHRITGQERAVKKVARKKIKNLDRFKQEIAIL